MLGINVLWEGKRDVWWRGLVGVLDGLAREAEMDVLRWPDLRYSYNEYPIVY
jgi:hypothetical protein